MLITSNNLEYSLVNAGDVQVLVNRQLFSIKDHFQVRPFMFAKIIKGRFLIGHRSSPYEALADAPMNDLCAAIEEAPGKYRLILSESQQ